MDRDQDLILFYLVGLRRLLVVDRVDILDLEVVVARAQGPHLFELALFGLVTHVLRRTG